MTTDRRSIIAGAGVVAAGLSLASTVESEAAPAPAPDGRTARVVGLGGVFLKVEDTKAWRAWYERVLGVTFTSYGSAVFPHPVQGVEQISPFAADTTYFKPSQAPFMINLIVEDIDGLVARAAAQGVPCLDRQDGSYGRFAWFLDPAGVKVELWEPPGDNPPAG